MERRKSSFIAEKSGKMYLSQVLKVNISDKSLLTYTFDMIARLVKNPPAMQETWA